MNCPLVSELVHTVESGETPELIADHIAECDSCNHLVTGLREEAQGLSVSIGGIWFGEGISCPHRDLLLNWMEGGLDSAQADYIDFHLNVINCPTCNAALGECASELDGAAGAQVEAARGRSLDQTRSWIDSSKPR